MKRLSAGGSLPLLVKFYFLFLPVLPLMTAISYAAEPPAGNGSDQCQACRQFEQLNTLIRDRRIDRKEAGKQLAVLLSAIRLHTLQQGAEQYGRNQWVFPLAGYNAKSAGNPTGAGYQASGYDYLDGNAHGGHPSLDLFIRDRNQDSLDDESGKDVKVLSMTGGIVVAAENSWQNNSRLRGGKYIWIYDPSSAALVYYAHNRELLVKTGDMVKPGAPIALVGRTGLNAARKRSPTHLHLTFLKITDGYPRPENIFNDLKNAVSYKP